MARHLPLGKGQPHPDMDHEGLLWGLPASQPALSMLFLVVVVVGGASFQKATLIIPPPVKIPPWLPITLLAPSTCLQFPSGLG